MDTNNGILLSCKDNEIVNFPGKWMELDKIILNEVSQDQRDKRIYFLSYEGHNFSFLVCMFNIEYMWKLRK